MKFFKHALIIVILHSTAVIGNSQGTDIILNKADKAFHEYEFKKALKLYQKVLKTDSSAHIIRGVAQSLSYLQQPKESTKYFRMLVDKPNPLPLDILEYAQSLKRAGNYEEALVWVEKYREIYPLDLRARNHSVNSHHYKKLARNKKNPLFFALDINDEENIMGFTKYEDGVIFSRSENNSSLDCIESPGVFLDLMSASLTPEKELEHPKFLPHVLNANFHDGSSSYHEATSTLYFTRNAAQKKGTKGKGSRFEILSSQKEDGKWQKPISFKFNSEEYSLGHPTISPNGKELYFVSNQPGGFGGKDIYVSKKRGREWTKPENLGPEVNTESDEVFPYITDGQVLYFATEGHAGLGGLDVFKTYPFEEFWAQPENLGAPVNSRANDFGLLFIHQGEALFISDRISGKGSGDAYYVNFQETDKFFTIPSILIENENVSPIRVINLDTGEELFYRKEETALLALDGTGSSYKVTWKHMGESREILINGTDDQTGALNIQLKGLEGIKPQDFLSQINTTGIEKENKIKIDQKVWTYESAESKEFLAENNSEPTNYVRGKDNIITLDRDGHGFRAPTFPEPENYDNKTILCLKENYDNNTTSYKSKLATLLSSYDGESNVTIKLIKSDKLSPAEMESFGEEIEEIILSYGITPEKIKLGWMDGSSVSVDAVSSSDFEIYITADTNFSFTE
ncbi:MAG: tetratricopeptide (TPR) repeat protein [Flavobacteriales bacterium]|jgi:tetratricopeptide (TPR) repeat protein